MMERITLPIQTYNKLLNSIMALPTRKAQSSRFLLSLIVTYLLCSFSTLAQPSALQQQRPSKSIRIALSVDEYSLKDFLIVMSAVMSTAENPSKVIFHIVACAKDMESAKILQHQISNAIKSCYQSKIKYYSVPFMLPHDSGFSQQLKAG